MKLLVDVMLGTLARHLRMCGYDAAYALDRGIEDDEAVLAIAAEEGRCLVTRDVDLAARLEGAVLVESLDVDEQLAELLAAGFELSLTCPERCSVCNGPLELVGVGDATPGYAPDPEERPVWRCPDCGQHFWRGSHWDDVGERLSRIRRSGGDDSNGQHAVHSES